MLFPTSPARALVFLKRDIARMYLKTHPLRNAIAIALVASCSAPAFAQTATDGTTNLDRIEITGSRIRQASVESASRSSR